MRAKTASQLVSRRSHRSSDATYPRRAARANRFATDWTTLPRAPGTGEIVAGAAAMRMSVTSSGIPSTAEGDHAPFVVEGAFFAVDFLAGVFVAAAFLTPVFFAGGR